MKALKEAQVEITAQPDIPSAEIPSSAVGDDTAGKPRESTALDSVPIPMLPPRKRLKLTQSEHNTVSTEDTGSSVAVVEVGRDGDADKYSQDDFIARTLLESEQSSGIQSSYANLKRKPLQDSEACAANSGIVASVRLADGSHGTATATNFNSAAKYSFASLSSPGPQQARPTSLSREKTRRGRKPRQTTTTPVTAIAEQPAAVYHSWAATNGSTESHVAASAPPPLAATPTPNVIHIPEDAQVLQMDDGLLIVCQSDGTVQIHGHAEGQPIPMDTIRSVLAMDTTVLAVDDGGQVPQETDQSLYCQSVPLTDYGTVGQTTAADYTQSLVPVDGRQYVTMDGGTALMAYDPGTQSVVQIDAGQSVITLPDGNTFFAVDGSQSMLTADGRCYAEQAVVGNSALLHLLPSSHMQQ